uniref:helix-turn-helix domain-containing protein n=1 Tax=Sandaracinus sp. TaxID=2024858 RepID=UPI0019D4BBB1|nr:helix-turn-helix domain-containing protein [Sandaracinus sp.]
MDRLACHAAVVLVGVERDVEVTLSDNRVARGRALVVKPDVGFSSSCVGTTVTVLCDLDRAARGWISSSDVEIAPLSRTTELLRYANRAAMQPQRPDIELATCMEEIATADVVGVHRHDAIIRRILLAAANDSISDWNVEQMAAVARVSPTHLRATFHREIGLTPRTWLRWTKMARAFEMLTRATPIGLGVAALEAGFADHSHFTRTCVEFLGRTPSSLLARNRDDSDDLTDPPHRCLAQSCSDGTSSE